LPGNPKRTTTASSLFAAALSGSDEIIQPEPTTKNRLL
jgi:hypothetical protein